MQFRRGFAVYFAPGVSRRIRIDWWSYMALMYDSEAKIENGVLTLRVPKAESARPKVIKVAAH